MEYEANQNMKVKNLSQGYPFPYVVQYVTDVYTYLHFFHISLRTVAQNWHDQNCTSCTATSGLA